ncbi:MAG: fused MFS/spermidine synthase [Planctomycetes bacterium]|nr:fused MFS/spermidine synthase [Planctomycetota bacterium]
MRFIILLVFFVSGAAGLLYEVVWTRQLTLLLGVTAPAVSTVLATFMAGLGIGGAAAGRMIKNRDPLKFYAFCEVGIAILGFASPYVLDALAPVYVFLKQTIGGGPALTAARAALSALVLLPPALFMGATLPALSKWILTIGGDGRRGRGVGLLYAVNTVGAVAGTIAAAYFTIETFGMRGSIGCAAALNGVATIGAWSLSRAGIPAAPAASGTLNITFSAGARRAALIAAALSGAAGLACEGIWTRYLIYAVGDNSAYAFADMLAIFLAGIAAGSALAAPFVDKFKNPLLALAVIQGALACACVASVALLEPKGRYAGLGDWLTGETYVPWATFLWTGVWSSAKVVFIPTLLFGASFPFVARIVTRGAETAAADVGRSVAWNTAGSIAGAIASGFVLLPMLGFAKGMIAAASLSLLAMLAALAPAASLRFVKFIVAAIVCIAFGALSLVALSRRDAAARALIKDETRDTMKFYEDGAVSSVAVVEDNITKTRVLYVGGDAQASTDPVGMLHLRLMGHLPALFHENPKSGLVICCGAGVTLGSLASHPLETLEICDLSPTILQLNKDGVFDGGNNGVFRDPRLRVTVDDGRNHLLSTTRTYDVITTDPIDPDDAGVTSIYCKEFYELVSKRLNPGGVACQWMTTQYSLDVYKSLIQAFRLSFPECYIYDGDFTTVIVGRKPGGRRVAFDRLERAFEDRKVKSSLAAVGIDDPYDLLTLQLAGPADIANFCGDAPPNSDDRPIAEVVAPRTEWGNPRGSWIEKQRVLLSMRKSDRGDAIADWSAEHAARFKEKYRGMQRSMDARLARNEPGGGGAAKAEAVLRSLISTGPRTVDLMAEFDECDFEPGEDVGEYLLQIDFGIEALLPDAPPPNYDKAEAAKFAKYCFRSALMIRPDSLRGRLGLALACARLLEHAAAIDYARQVTEHARYATDYLQEFTRHETQQLINAVGDANEGTAAAEALEKLNNIRLDRTVEAWNAWFQKQPGAPAASKSSDAK